MREAHVTTSLPSKIGILPQKGGSTKGGTIRHTNSSSKRRRENEEKRRTTKKKKEGKFLRPHLHQPRQEPPKTCAMGTVTPCESEELQLEMHILRAWGSQEVALLNPSPITICPENSSTLFVDN